MHSQTPGLRWELYKVKVASVLSEGHSEGGLLYEWLSAQKLNSIYLTLVKQMKSNLLRR